MKTKFLFFVAMACNICVMATGWVAPQPATVPLTKGENVYFYNAEARKFVFNGNQWGEEVSLSDANAYLMMVQDTIFAYNGGEAEPEAVILNNVTRGRYFAMEGDGSYTWNDRKPSESNELSIFKLRVLEDGSFMYGPTKTQLQKWGYQKELWSGWSGNKNDTRVRTIINPDLAEMADASVIWHAVTPEAFEIYQVRKKFYSLLLDAEANGVETSEAGEVYTRPDATKAELEDAIDLLLELIRRTVLTDASVEHPVDATFLMENPDFSTGSLDGWTLITELSYGVQSTPYNNGEAGVHIEKFAETWTPAGQNVKDGGIQQTLFRLPAGQYRLEADVIATQQGNASVVVEGVSIFADGKDGRCRTACATANGVPEHYSVDFNLEDNATVTVGFQTINANANWLGADNFKLTYYGRMEDDPNAFLKMKLNERLDQVQAKRDRLLSEQAMPADICEEVDAMRAAIAESSDESELNAIGEKMEGLAVRMDAVAAEVDALAEVYVYFSDMYEVVGANDTQGLGVWLEGLLENFLPGMTWATVDDMRSEARKMRDGWAAYVMENADECSGTTPVDISEVIANRGFFHDGNNSVVGWTLSEGYANRNSELEYWNCNFNVHQTVAALPRATYELRVQGFYRMGGHAEAARDEADYTGHSVLYANVGEEETAAPLMSIFADASTKSIYASGEVKESVTIDGVMTHYYIPNDMEGAQEYYQYDAEHTGLSNQGFYQGNKVVFYTDGTQPVTIGIRKEVLIDNDWTNFDNFQLFLLDTKDVTSVQDGVSDAVVTGRQYYTLGGIRLSRPQKGVNIEVTMYADGSRRTKTIIY